MNRGRGDDRRAATRCILALPAIVLAAGVLLQDAIGAGERSANPGIAVTGAIEGTVALPPSTNAKTADRYISDTGEPRDIQTVPVVVYLEGPVGSRSAVRPSGPTKLIQRGEAFDPTILVVSVGTQLEFPNGDRVFHNVFSYSRAKRFDLGRYRQGESKSVVFDRPGYVKVLCEVHKWMRAAVLVVENPHYAIVPESGRFRIDGTPAGRHRVTVEHFDRRLQIDVQVPDGGTANIAVKL